MLSNGTLAASWFAQHATERALKSLYQPFQGVLAAKHALERLGAEAGVSAEVVELLA